MKKKGIKLIVLSGLFISVILMTFLTIKLNKIKQNRDEERNQILSLPNFTSFYSNGIVFNSVKLKKEKTLCIIRYEVDCDFCQNEALSINNNIDRLNSAHIIFITSNKLSSINLFVKKYLSKSINKIDVLWDKDGNFDRAFGYHSSPSIYIYNKDHRLTKAYHQSVKIDDILTCLN